MSSIIHSSGNKSYKQCTRCVMDTSDPEIVFDSEGKCNHCTNYLKEKSSQSYQGVVHDKMVERFVSRLKKDNKHKKYDCVVGVSGGADGCYAAVTCKQLGLRALLVHMDNGWNSKIAVENIKTIADKLEFDYISYVLDWEEFKDLQLSFLKASVPEIETPTDIAILSCMHKAAVKYEVKCIILGCNFATEGILPKSWHYDSKDKKYQTSIQKKFGKVRLKTFPFFDYWDEMYYKIVKRVKIFYLLNYIPYTRKTAVNVLKELGWKDYSEKHHESHYTKLVQAYILPVKFNIDYRKAFLSAKICNGRVIREEAQQLLLKPPYNAEETERDIEYVCKKLSITVNEFNEIMKLPVKTHNDYPNDKKIISFVYKTYLYLKRIKLI